jgi:uncharacterized protein YjaZ
MKITCMLESTIMWDSWTAIASGAPIIVGYMLGFHTVKECLLQQFLEASHFGLRNGWI